MKRIIILALLISSSAYAETCSNLTKEGTVFYKFGEELNMEAVKHHRLAVKEHHNSNRPATCQALIQAKNAFALSAEQFRSCADSFDNAIMVCHGRRVERAENNHKTCIMRNNTALNNRGIEAVNIRKLCENKSDEAISELEL